MKNLIKIICLAILICGLKINFLKAQTFTMPQVKGVITKDIHIKRETRQEFKSKDGLTVNYNFVKDDTSTYVSGVVLDNENYPMPGVSIKEKGTKNVVISDIEGKFSIKINPETVSLDITSIGLENQTLEFEKDATESTSSSPKEEKGDANAITSLTGMFVGSDGEEVVAQPNILISQNWVLIKEKLAIQMRFSGLQTNKDTIRFSNGIYLNKPEISKYNFELSAYFQNKFVFINLDLGVYKQQLNWYDNSTPSPIVKNGNITNSSAKLSAGVYYESSFYIFAQLNYFNVLNGVDNYISTFGNNAPKSFLNFELCGKFQVTDGIFKGVFLQPILSFHSNKYQDILGTQDKATFILKVGFDKPIFYKEVKKN
jgi:hypothetical protein